MDLDQLRKLMREGRLGKEKTTSEKLSDVANLTQLVKSGQFVKSDDTSPPGSGIVGPPSDWRLDDGLVQSVSLVYREGASDKVYDIRIFRLAGSYDVIAEYGRRGKALRENRILLKVSRREANQAFDKQYNAKIKKGYKCV